MQTRFLGLCLFAGTLLVPAALPTSSQTATKPDDAKTYTIERVLTKGTVERYNIVFKTEGKSSPLGELAFDMVLRETTKELQDNVAQVNSVFDDASLVMSGNKSDLTQSFPTIKYKADKLGRMWDIKIEGGIEQLRAALSVNLITLALIRSSFYPPKAMKKGDSWEVAVSAVEKKKPEDKDTVTAKGKATLVGTEKIASFDAVKIKAELEVLPDPMSSKPDKFKGEALIDSVTGKILVVKGTIEGSFGQGGETKAEVSLSLLNEEPIKDVRDKKPEVKK